MFAGSFGLAQAAAVCNGGNPAEALDVIDRLAGKSLLTVEMAASGTRYRMLETIRQYAVGRLTGTGGTEAAQRRHAYTFLTLAERERAVAALSRLIMTTSAPRWTGHCGRAMRPGRGWPGRWAVSGSPAGSRGRPGDWLERALAPRPADEQVRAELLRLLGAVLFESGYLASAKAVLSEGCAVAQAAGLRRRFRPGSVSTSPRSAAPMLRKTLPKSVGQARTALGHDGEAKASRVSRAVSRGRVSRWTCARRSPPWSAARSVTARSSGLMRPEGARRRAGLAVRP